MTARMVVVLALITLIASLALGLVYQKTEPKIAQQKVAEEAEAMRLVLPEASCGIFVKCGTDTFTFYKGYRKPDTTGFVGYVIKTSCKGYSSTIETLVGVGSDGSIRGLKILSQQETPGLGTRIAEVKSTRTVADALKKAFGRGTRPRFSIKMKDDEGNESCIEVIIRDPYTCGRLDSSVAVMDTAGVFLLAQKALSVSAADSSKFLTTPEMAFSIAARVTEEIRKSQTPWFLEQFIGKKRADLVIVSEKTDRYIQAITGATISSNAVTSSVREALSRLEMEIGGFEEKKD
ncbi:MAG: FMN-binding protein [bacterium]